MKEDKQKPDKKSEEEAADMVVGNGADLGESELEQECEQEQEDGQKQKVGALEARVKELENNWKRALADYRNLEKRVREEKQEVVKFANSVLLFKLLGIVDNLEMVEKSVADTGLSLILKEFEKVLEEYEVTSFGKSGEEFDADLMVAAELVDGEKDKVIDVLQKGYKIHDKLLRPARVNVGKGGN